jgi:hypothetical protein
MMRRAVAEVIAAAIGAGGVLLVTVLYLPSVLYMIEPGNRFLVLVALAAAVTVATVIAARRGLTAAEYSTGLAAATISGTLTFFVWAYPASQSCVSDIETGGRVVCTPDLGLALFFTAAAFLGAASAAAVAGAALWRED